MQHASESLITIANYVLPHEAQLAKVQLELAGFPVFLADEHITSIRGWYGFRVRVQVPGSVAAAARAILTEYEAKQNGVENAEAACPQCGGLKTGNSRAGFMDILFMLVMGFPFMKPAKRKHCLDCGHRWKMR